MDLTIPYLITSSVLILIEFCCYKFGNTNVSLSTESTESTESSQSSSRITTLSDGLSIRDTDKSGTELILDPPIDTPMHPLSMNR